MKKIFSFILTIVLSLCALTNVNAITQTITFTESKRFDNYRSVLYQGAGTTYKTASIDGQTVMAYCLNHAKNAPAPGSKLKYRELSGVEKQNEDAFIYILEHGYGGNWSLGEGYTTEQKYYITQLAIWFTQERISPGSGVKSGNLGKLSGGGYNTALREQAVKLANAAKTYKQTDPTISIKEANNRTTMYLTSDKKYYRTDDYNVGGSGFSSYTITLTNVPAGTQIVEVGTNKTLSSGSSLKAGSKFYVRVPVSKVGTSLKPTIKVSASATLKRLAAYLLDSSVQDIGIYYKEPKSVSANATASVTPVGSLKISKKQKNVAGEISDLKDVTIVVKNSAGKDVATWSTTTDNPKTIENLPIGTYTVTEKQAPSGYVKASPVSVSVRPNEITTVELINVKDRQPVYISKQDATTGTELPGAHMVLKNALGTVVEEWTSTTTPHLVEKKLTPGKYTLSETIAPEGYQLSTETVTFMVNNDGGVDEPVVMKNKPKTSVKISKQDVTTKKELPGAHLVVKDSTGKIVDEWVSTTTPHYLPEDLAPGKYTLIETISPEGYGISEEVIEFEITADGVEKTIVMTNSPIPVTADMNTTLIIVGLVATVLLAGFSIFKLNKQQA